MRFPLALVLLGAFTGHLLAVILVLAGPALTNTTLIAAIGCSIVAITAARELARSIDPEARGVVWTLIAAQGLAAAMVLSGLVPNRPWPLPVAGMVLAASLGPACLGVMWRGGDGKQPASPVIAAPRLAAIAVVTEALMTLGANDAPQMPAWLQVAWLLAIAALGAVALASLSIVALRMGPWGAVGALAWLVGWVARTADLASAIAIVVAWLRGAPLPTEVSQLDGMTGELSFALGGLLIGGALVRAVRDSCLRRTVLGLLAGYALCQMLAATIARGLDHTADLDRIEILRWWRAAVEAVASFALAGVLWLYRRHVSASNLPRATIR